MIKLKINNRVVEVEPGSTILQAAQKLGIFIPTFCNDDLGRLPAKYCMNCHEFGDCKMCSCEVEGYVSLLTACNTPAQEGMVVWTESEEVKSARISILLRLLATHPLDCMNCGKLGDCKLQKYCEMYGVTGPVYQMPYLHREKRAGYIHSSTSGLSPREQLERQEESHPPEKTRPDSPVPTCRDLAI